MAVRLVVLGWSLRILHRQGAGLAVVPIAPGHRGAWAMAGRKADVRGPCTLNLIERECRAMDYEIRRSQRARHVWLRFDQEGGLVVVVPRKFDIRQVPAIVESHQDRVRRNATRAASRRDAGGIPSPVSLPDSIVLRALGEEWRVKYRATSGTRVKAVECDEGRLIVSGATADAEACRRALLRWLSRSARHRLGPLLREVACEHGFVLPRVTVRAQRTRWASCSRGGVISLNIRLLFAPHDAVRHVMLHELCHTRCMDHSARFWTMLRGLDPGWRERRNELRTAWHEVPSWFWGTSVCHDQLTTANNNAID
jgi:predicted metal-dependent hydrolase